MPPDSTVRSHTKSLVSRAAAKLQSLSHATEPRVLAEMLDKQYQEFYLNIVGTALISLLFLLSVDGATESTFAWIWCTAQWTLELVHFVQCRVFLRTPRNQRDYSLWYRRALGAIFLSGLLWGLAPYAFFTIANELNAVVITGTAALILAGGLALVHLPGGYIAFGILAMSLLAVAAFALSSDWHLIAYMGLTGLVIMVKFSLNTNRSVADSINLRLQNADLVDELERANDAKSKFLATASHDLRQPLQALSLLTTAVTDQGYADSSTLNSMQRSVENLNALFNSILDISKLDAGVIKASPQVIRLSSLLEYVHDQFEDLGDQNGLKFEVTYDPETWINTDPILTRRILLNIVDNAFNNTDSGLIEIRAERIEDTVTITIKDTGRGIAPVDIEKIFAEFYQSDASPNQRKRGMGLGLSIVKRLADLQQHRVTLSSELDQGSQFCVALPAASSAIDKTEVTERSSLGAPDSVQKTILTIENEIDISDAMSILLTAWGYTVLSAEDSAAAFTVAARSERNIDLLISDYQLDENDNGLELCRALQDSIGKKVPIIIVTGNTDAETIKQMQQSEITLLHKPVFPPQLRLAIENNLKEANV